MKYVVGYDKDLARQFFIRTLRELALFSEGRIFLEETDYVATRLSETTIFNIDPKIGSPWFNGDIETIKKLACETKKTEDRRLLQKAEDAANRILITEGILKRGGLQHLRENAMEDRSFPTEYEKLASTLYRNASNRPSLTESSRFALRRMSFNTKQWIDLLAFLPGNDYLEMLGQETFSTIIMP